MSRLARSLWLPLLIALLAAAAITAAASATPYEPRLLRVAAADALPASVAQQLEDEPESISALFLSWADDPALVFNGALALQRHGDLARRVLGDYGFDPAFTAVLARYGPDAVLPVGYFHDNAMPSLSARHWAAQRYQGARDSLTGWWRPEPAPDSATAEAPLSNDAPSAASDTLTPQQRGRYAIAFLQQGGYGFLDQFVVDERGAAHWLQGERLVTALGDFFTGGLRDLERIVQSDAGVRPADIAWAGVDVLMVAGAVRLLRAGRAVRLGAVEGRAVAGAGSELRASRAALLPVGLRFAQLSRMAKVAAVGTTAWLVVRHPALISGLGANLAQWLGWPARLGQFLLWSLVLLPLLWLAGLLYRWFLRPMIWLLMFAGRRSCGLRLVADASRAYDGGRIRRPSRSTESGPRPASEEELP
ncbi:hypothetical protein [Kushneria aurantia]|uniref:DUF4350 domain-containing protein n=1 Tax=Kushneria aurantia TaxID=504092 RepID=A0ABV6G7S5_9GAMM|nr:hypothetical protein [Kushneria aurantia]